MDERLNSALNRVVAAVNVLRVRAEEEQRAAGHDTGSAERRERMVGSLELLADQLEAALA